MKPYYQDSAVTIYHGDCREIVPDLPQVDLVLTDPPYPNKADHFVDSIGAAVSIMWSLSCPRWFVFWDELQPPPSPIPIVAKHIWHRTNTNRPDNYEAIYELATDGIRKSSRVMTHAVIFPGLTGCSQAMGHPTQKNEKLLTEIINLRPATLILDPFMGSGTTLRAAKDLGRKAIGIEIEEKYCEIAAQRMAQEVLPLEMVA
jgi:site-specific DNA-methyltransferase (adenine-specific)